MEQHRNIAIACLAIGVGLYLLLNILCSATECVLRVGGVYSETQSESSDPVTRESSLKTEALDGGQSLGYLNDSGYSDSHPLIEVTFTLDPEQELSSRNNGIKDGVPANLSTEASANVSDSGLKYEIKDSAEEEFSNMGYEDIMKHLNSKIDGGGGTELPNAQINSSDSVNAGSLTQHLSESVANVKEQVTESESKDCQKLHFREKYLLPLTALASFPGCGNTWVRHLIQQATGRSIKRTVASCFISH